MAIFISHSSAIPLYLDVVTVTFKCLAEMYIVWSMMTVTVILYR